MAVVLISIFGAVGGADAADIFQQIEIPSSFNPVGSGARALGMGGAFIAVADDATAASWNPAGLAQLDFPEVSVVGGGFIRTEENTFGTNPEANGDESVDKTKLNYLSAAYPFTLGGYPMVVSLNYQYLFDFTRQWDFPLNLRSSFASADEYVSYRQDGELTALGLAYSIQASPKFNFGFTLNFWDDGLTDNSWDRETYQWGTGVFNGERAEFAAYSHDRYAFEGFNVNLGMLWRVTDQLRLGAVFKTPFDADLEYRHSAYAKIIYPDLPGFGSTTRNDFKEDQTLTMPMSYGIGAVYRFTDTFKMSLDVYRTEWGDFELEDARGEKTSPISGKPMDESDVDATHQVRLGAEYRFGSPESKFLVPVRAGLFYDPAPAEGSPDDFYGVSLGAGLVYRERFSLDVAYQYRFGNDVSGSILEEFDFSQDVREHTVYVSMIFYFDLFGGRDL